jgi:hypothetical protein
MQRQNNDDFHASLVEHGVKSKKPRLFKKIIRAFKSCFGHGFDSADAPSRRDYVRSQDAATGFEGKDIYGVEAEYLDEDDMAWGGSSRKKSPRRQKMS